MKKLFVFFAVFCSAMLLCGEELPQKEKNWSKGLDDSWLIHYDEAVEKAKAEGKNILVLNIVSDSVPGTKMQKEVLKKSRFKSFASNRYVFLWIDAPSKRKLPAKQQAHNLAVGKKVKLTAAPQIKIINIDGTVIGTCSKTKEKDVVSFLKKTSQNRGTLIQRSKEE